MLDVVFGYMAWLRNRSTVEMLLLLMCFDSEMKDSGLWGRPSWSVPAAPGILIYKRELLLG